MWIGKTKEKPRSRGQVEPWSSQVFRVSFAEMQRMHLRKLQIKLINHAFLIHNEKDESICDWEADLAAYSESLPSLHTIYRKRDIKAMANLEVIDTARSESIEGLRLYDGVFKKTARLLPRVRGAQCRSLRYVQDHQEDSWRPTPSSRGHRAHKSLGIMGG